MQNDEFKILIVDDDRASLDILCRMLQPEAEEVENLDESLLPNFKISIAKTGESALKIAENEKPDLILLDILMPGLSGFEVLSALKASDTTRSIPVIIITGLDSVSDEEKGFSLGAVDYITKPFHKSLVKARILTHLRIVKQMRIIEHFGLIDTLTNIPNRRSFDNQIATEWRCAIRDKTPLSFLMIDVDHFKNFNDTYGHQHGDIVLKRVARLIKSVIKRPTDFAARWGGEEFAILLPKTAANGAMNVAEEIRTNIGKTNFSDIIDTQQVTVSIGVTTITPTTSDIISDYIDKADKALYTAKETGRNRVCSE